jgi:hypothetical protein
VVTGILQEFPIFRVRYCWDSGEIQGWLPSAFGQPGYRGRSAVVAAGELLHAGMTLVNKASLF